MKRRGPRAALGAALLISGCAPDRTGRLDDEAWQVVVRRPAALVERFPVADSLTLGRALALEAFGAEAFILDQMDGRVHRVSSDGRLVNSIGRAGQGPGELGGAIALKAGADGHIWVASIELLRLSRFEPGGGLADEYRTPYPVVNFAVLGSDRPIVPFLAPGALLARLTSSGDTVALHSAALPGSGLRDVRQRIGLLSMLMQPIDDTTLVLLRNKQSDDFDMWRVGVSGDSAHLVPIGLPTWLFRLMADETRVLESELDADFRASGDFMIPFKGLHRDAADRLWLIPSPSHRLIALGLPIPGDSLLQLVVPSEREEYRGMLDAVVLEDRIFILDETNVRVYELEPLAGATLESIDLR